MVTNDNFVYNQSWFARSSIIIALALILFQRSFNASVARVKIQEYIRTFMGQSIGITLQFTFAVMHLMSIFDDLYFLYISIYPYWFLLFLNCLAVTILPIYCFGMAFKMARPELEGLIR